MKILIITDAWSPQINGVVRTYENLIEELKAQGNVVEVVHPYCYGFKRVKLPGYPEIELATNPWRMRQKIWVAMQEGWKIHIATEGPLGLFAKIYCKRNWLSYTTSFHTLFPEFIETRFHIPTSFTYWYFRWFHRGSKAVLAPSSDMKKHLEDKGFENIAIFTRGVNSKIFNPKRRTIPSDYIICVSRISKEKGLDDFCQLKGRKVLIGDGPYLNELRKKYPDVEYLGKKEGPQLAQWIANALVFVFPSKADTFGIVILESIACGTPVAAYEQPGPKEVIANFYNGYYGNDLQQSVNICYTLNRGDVYNSSKIWTWKRAAQQFIKAINYG